MRAIRKWTFVVHTFRDWSCRKSFDQRRKERRKHQYWLWGKFVIIQEYLEARNLVFSQATIISCSRWILPIVNERKGGNSGRLWNMVLESNAEGNRQFLSAWFECSVSSFERVQIKKKMSLMCSGDRASVRECVKCYFLFIHFLIVFIIYTKKNKKMKIKKRYFIRSLRRKIASFLLGDRIESDIKHLFSVTISSFAPERRRLSRGRSRAVI